MLKTRFTPSDLKALSLDDILEHAADVIAAINPAPDFACIELRIYDDGTRRFDYRPHYDSPVTRSSGEIGEARDLRTAAVQLVQVLYQTADARGDAAP